MKFLGEFKEVITFCSKLLVSPWAHSITDLFNLVAKESSLASRTTKLIEMIFKFGERNSMGEFIGP
jgi:hypothetical protein